MDNISYNDSGAVFTSDWLTDAKLHLRVDHSDEDDVIDIYIKAAYNMAEYYTRQAIISRSFTAYLDYLPSCIGINRTPVTAVASVKYYDSDDTLTTIDSANYSFNENDQPLRIYFESDYQVTDIKTKPGAVEVAFTAGYSSYANIPGAIKSAILLIVGHLYENREEVVVGRIATQMPKAAEYLLDAYRIYLN